MGNRAEVQGPERYPLPKSHRSSFSRLNLKGIETRKDFHVAEEEYDLGLYSCNDEGHFSLQPSN